MVGGYVATRHQADSAAGAYKRMSFIGETGVLLNSDLGGGHESEDVVAEMMCRRKGEQV